MIRRLVIALSLSLLTGCGYAGLQDLPLPGSPPVGGDPYTVTARFTNVLDLARDSTVKLNGVTVGRVDSITRDGWTAEVGLALQHDVDLPANVVAQIRQTGLLGEQYVALVEPASPVVARLHGGSVIPLSSTGSDYDVEEVLGALSLLLNGGGLGQLQTITVQLRDALGDAGGTRAFIAQLGTLVATLDRNRTLIVSAMRHVASLSSQLSAERGTVSKALDSIGRAMTVLAGQQAQIVAMLRHLDGFSRATTAVVRTSGDDLRATLTSLQPVLAQLEHAGDHLPEVLGTILSFPFPDDVLTAIKGDYVNLDVVVDLSPLVLAGNFTGKGLPIPDLGVLGALVGLGSPTAGKRVSPVTGLLALQEALTTGSRR